jgi:type I restriction enzyme S subunit
MDSHLLDSKFALRAVLSPYFQSQLLQRGTGSTALGIKASKLPQLQILCPPVTEQTRILDWIDSECAPLAKAVARARSEIDLLREYRTRLIADVVTGKLDVRESAARLPDDIDEPEPVEAEGEDGLDGTGDADAVREEAEA